MKIFASTAPAQRCDCDALVVPVFEGDELLGPLAELDKAAKGFFSDMLRQSAISSKRGEVVVFHRVAGVAASRVVLVGAGVKSLEAFDPAVATVCGGAAVRSLAGKSKQRLAFDFGSIEAPILASAVAGAMNGSCGQDLLRAARVERPIEEMQWLGADEAAIARGVAIGEGLLLVRELVNLPANYMYPEAFAARAAQVALAEGLELEVWDELRLRRENCGAILAVSAGSSRPPRLLVMRYRGTQQEPPLALVGKGVTFDSGGLSLKPSDGMLAMKCDMAGAATVLGAMQTIAKLGVSMPVVGVVGLVENMISGSSYKLGDVLTSRSGKTIEVHNTDAEGRLVLADALDVALDDNPRQIVDVATLTGACLVALGKDIAGLMGNCELLQRSIQRAAEACGELVWPLPMHALFDEQVQSKVADLKNLGDGRWGGAITAAKFLEQFVQGTPWQHIDIAGPAFADSPKSHLDAGASGALMRTLVQLAETV